MFAVIKTGGKQYRVAAGDTITVEKLAGEPGEVIAFEQVLMLVDGATTEVGVPSVAGATVAGELVEQTRGAKVIAFKKRRRKNSRRKRGHRQDLTVVKITDILTGGARPALKAKQAEAAPQVVAREEKPEVAEKAPKAKRAEAAPEAAAAPSADHDHAGIAAGAAAAVAGAKAKGIDTDKFQHLDEPIGQGDDLKLISGIGPTIEKKLNAIGIWHYWQLKALSEDDIAKVEHQVGFKGRAHRDHWMAQAADLMAGKGPRPKSQHDEH
ncbi:MAG: 50S ribosomal protein L21 [Hyphomicrobiales bacterium]